MLLNDFHGCCTVKIITGFGQTGTAEYDRYGDDGIEALRYDIFHACKNAKNYGYAMVCAITNNEQVNANKALRLEGFRYSPWCSKNNHPETEVRLWFKPLQELE